jgi:hypothetical protein
MKQLFYTWILSFLFVFVHAKVYEVGAGKTYSKPSALMGLLADGDTVYIDAGIYEGDAAVWTANNLLIKGTGGLAHMKANGVHAQGKAIWVITGDNCIIDHIEFSECSVPDENGAGIRMEGTNLTVRHCYFHHNENGILAGSNSNSNIVVEFCEFAHNGFGDGFTHNIYINHIQSFTLRFSYMHHAHIGHNAKSRAYHNFILYNRIMDENNGDASMLLDLPNGGFSLVMGNLFMQGPQATNKRLISYGSESLTNPVNKLYVVNNTMLNKRHTGTFVYVENGTSTAKLINNLFCGTGDILEGVADTTHNMYFSDIADAFLQNESAFDYQLTQYSPAIDRGTDPGMADTFPLNPNAEYLHPVSYKARTNDDAHMDIGAYEYEKMIGTESFSTEKFKLWPNPVSETLNICIPDNDAGNHSEIMIYDLHGVLLMHQKMSRKGICNLEALKAGTYILEICSGQKLLFRNKILLVK